MYSTLGGALNLGSPEWQQSVLTTTPCHNQTLTESFFLLIICLGFITILLNARYKKVWVRFTGVFCVSVKPLLNKFYIVKPNRKEFLITLDLNQFYCININDHSLGVYIVISLLVRSALTIYNRTDLQYPWITVPIKYLLHYLLSDPILTQVKTKGREFL